MAFDDLGINSLGGLGIRPLGLARRRRQDDPLAGLTPEQQDSLINNALGAAGSFAGWLGETLDKPGRAVRGTISGLTGGDWGGGLLNLLPLSDTFGVTDPNEGVSGRDLLTHFGITPENRPGFQPIDDPIDALSDVGGFLTEIGTDPLSALSFGTTTAAGRAAKAAGTLSKGLGAGIKAGERSLLSVGLPFRDPLMELGVGSAKIGDTLSGIGETVRSTAPVRAARAALDPRVGGEYGRAAQQVQEIAYDARRQARAKGVLAGKKHSAAFEDALQSFDDVYRELVPDAPLPKDLGGFNVGDVVKASDRENIGRVVGSSDGLLDVHFKNPTTGMVGRARMNPDQLKLLYRKGDVPAGEFAREMTRSIFDRLVRFTAETGNVDRAVAEIVPEVGTGLPAELKQTIAGLTDDIAETKDALYQTLLDKGMRGGVIREVEPETDAALGFRHFPRYSQPEQLEKQGAQILRTATDSSKARDPIIRAIPELIVNRLLKDPKLRITEPVFRTVRGKVKKVGEKAASIEQEADAIRHLADTYGEYLPANVTPGDVYEWVTRHSGAFESGQIDLFSNPSMDDLTRNLVQSHQADATLDQIHKLLWDTGRKGTGEGVPLAKAYEAAHIDPQRAMEYAARESGMTPQQLAALRVPQKVVDAVQGTWKVYEDPEWATAVGKFIDHSTGIFRESVTIPFPSHHARNFTGALYLMATAGEVRTPGDLLDLGRAIRAAVKMRKAPPKELLDELEAHGVVDRRHDLQGVEKLAGESIAPTSPLDFKKNRATAARYVDQNASLLDLLPKGKTVRRGYNTVMATGSAASSQVDWATRTGYYSYLKAKGYTPAAAAEETARVLFDYRDQTAFDRKWASRLVPFYGFSKRVLPITVKTLAEKPGGAMAQTVRASNVLSDDAEFTPKYLQERPLTTPLGGDRFLTGFGLPIEDPLGRIVPSTTLAGTIDRTLEKNLASLHPAINFAYSAMSGQDAYSGRPLENLYRFPTSDPLANLVVSKSPLSRASGEVREMIDPRKDWLTWALNFGTGLDVADVSPDLETVRLREADDALRRLASSSPNLATFSTVYARGGDDALSRLTGSDRDAIQLERVVRRKKREQAQTHAENKASLAGQLSR